jgi:DNA-binding protein Fis
MYYDDVKQMKQAQKASTMKKMLGIKRNELRKKKEKNKSRKE